MAIAVFASYLEVRHLLLGQIDGALAAQASAIQENPYSSLGDRMPSIPASDGGPTPVRPGRAFWRTVRFSDGGIHTAERQSRRPRSPPASRPRSLT